MVRFVLKRILFFITSLGGGGAERVLVNLVNNLDPNKYDITVQTLFDTGVNRQYLCPHIKYIPGFKKQFPGNVVLFKAFTPGFLYRSIIKCEYDIVVSYLEGLPARIVSGCPYKNTKLICWIHVEQNDSVTASYCFRDFNEAVKCYECFEKIICVADSVKKDFESIFPLPEPCGVLYNTNEDRIIIDKSKEVIDISFNKSKCNIITLGRLVNEKGYDRLVRVHKRLLDENIDNCIYVLGDGSERRNIEQSINELSLQKSFFLLGFRDNPYKYLSKADLFVCSSRREGFSTSVTEALILGIPVVSTRCSGAEELLGSNNEYGIVTENSEEGIYEGLRRMLTEPGLLEEYRSKATERGKRFSKENTVQAVEHLLDSI